MKVRVNLHTDPITLTVMSATGKEHSVMEVRNGKFLNLEIRDYETDYTPINVPPEFGEPAMPLKHETACTCDMSKPEILELVADYLNLKAKEMRDEKNLEPDKSFVAGDGTKK